MAVAILTPVLEVLVDLEGEELEALTQQHQTVLLGLLIQAAEAALLTLQKQESDSTDGGAGPSGAEVGA